MVKGWLETKSRLSIFDFKLDIQIDYSKIFKDFQELTDTINQAFYLPKI